jgi:hypothetical protein
MDDLSRQGLEEYAKSLDLSLEEVLALLEGALESPAGDAPENS